MQGKGKIFSRGKVVPLKQGDDTAFNVIPVYLVILVFYFTFCFLQFIVILSF